MWQPLSIGELRSVIRRPAFWTIGALLVVVSVLHYGESLEHPEFLKELVTALDLDRHAIERILFLAPIVLAGFLFGTRGAFITSLAAVAFMLPRCIFISEHPRDAFLETSAVFVLGNVVSITFWSLRKERERRTQLEEAEETLQAQLEVIKESEERLSALNQTSSILSQSLDLKQVLDRAVENVIEMTRVEAAWILLLDRQVSELCIAACRGTSKKFVESAGKVKLGQGLNGRVALIGEPIYVDNAGEDPRLATMAWKEEGIQSLLIVPLKSKGDVVGALCVAMHSHRQFGEDEIELLTAIGNQIGVAVENARLYRQQQEITEQLRISEERYRELFENAHDSIFIHNLDGHIVAANRAFVRLTGYSLEELNKLTATKIISEYSLQAVREIEKDLLEGRVTGSVSEVKMVKKDGAEVFVQLSTALVMTNGQPIALQHIARDITEENRMRDNLRFYLQEVTKAQEEERKRIARELHDDTIQSLVVLSRGLDEIASSTDGVSGDKRALIENAWCQTNTIMQDLRRLTQDLRPPTLDRLGLLPALEWLASEVEELSGIKVEVSISGTERRLPAEIELLIFRIAQEALRNVWRHSEASSTNLSVELHDGKFGMIIKDNGKGFDLPSSVGDLAREGKLGLAGIQERARLLGGSLRIDSCPGRGTTVTLEVPTA